LDGGKRLDILQSGDGQKAEERWAGKSYKAERGGEWTTKWEPLMQNRGNVKGKNLSGYELAREVRKKKKDLQRVAAGLTVGGSTEREGKHAPANDLLHGRITPRRPNREQKGKGKRSSIKQKTTERKEEKKKGGE